MKHYDFNVHCLYAVIIVIIIIYPIAIIIIFSLPLRGGNWDALVPSFLRVGDWELESTPSSHVLGPTITIL